MPEETPPKRWRWLRREGIDLGDAVVQFFSVLLGVLLALLISQWTHHRQQQAQARAAMRQQQAQVDEAMEAIRAELTVNRKQLHESVTHLYAEAKAMGDATANQNKPPRVCYEWTGWHAVPVVNITNAAYQTAIATQAMAHMPFQQAEQIAQVYGGQDILQTAFKLSRNQILFPGPRTLGVCIGTLEGMALSEPSISNTYTQFIGPDKTNWPQPPFGYGPHATK
ncbi:MAG: hypothetical protein ACREPH_13970 [Rhodanobacteraceae bacterium]